MTNTMTEAVVWPLVPACAANGISKTHAFRLAKTGELSTVLIGCRRYVVMDSLRSLPSRVTSSKSNGGAR